MAITVKKIYERGIHLYKMKLLAGEGGMNNLIEWVHMVEDSEAGTFLHGNELVFTAGVMNTSPDWLITFVKRLYEAGISAFVVNIGPHTREVPEEVIGFCNRHNLPLFTIPWETRMVDMTRDFCMRILKNSTREESVSSILKNLLFHVGDMDTQLLQLERYGLRRDSCLCFMGAVLHSREQASVCSEKTAERMRLIFEMATRSEQENYLTFQYSGNHVVCLVDADEETVRVIVERVLSMASDMNIELHIGVSRNKKGMTQQEGNLENMLAAVELAQRKNVPVIYYDKLDIYKLFVNVKEKGILREYYEDSVGRLEQYDRENHTELTDFLKDYLDSNASQQLVAEKRYMHRNTVNNQLKKIERVTGYSPLELKGRLRFYLAFLMRDVL